MRGQSGASSHCAISDCRIETTDSGKLTLAGRSAGGSHPAAASSGLVLFRRRRYVRAWFFWANSQRNSQRNGQRDSAVNGRLARPPVCGVGGVVTIHAAIRQWLPQQVVASLPVTLHFNSCCHCSSRSLGSSDLDCDEKESVGASNADKSEDGQTDE
jgi:hypothetical protein